MLNAMADLATRRSRTVIVSALIASIVAGALGAGVASRLQPYGADDPATESVQADRSARGGGLPGPRRHRPALRGRRDLSAGEASSGGARGADLQGSRGGPDQRLLQHRLAGVRLPGWPFHLSRGCPEADRRQAALGRREATRRSPRGHSRGDARRAGSRFGAGEQAGGERPAARRAPGVPAPLPALARVLPQPRRRLAAAADRGAGDRRDLLDAAGGQRVHVHVDLRPQPGHRTGARPGDRLQPVHGLPLPRGDRPLRTRPGGDAPNDGHLGPDHPLLVADRRGRARLAPDLPPAVPLLDGRRRFARGADRGRPRPRRTARDPRRARPPRQRTLAGVPAAASRARSAADGVGLLVSALSRRHAAAGSDRRRERGAAHHPRDPVLRHQVHPRRRDGAPDLGERASGGHGAEDGVPAAP